MRRTAVLALAVTTLISLVFAGSAFAGSAVADDAPSGQVRVDPAGVDIRAVVLDLTRGSVDLDGSMTTTRAGSTATVNLNADVLFAFDRADLSPQAAGRLAETVAALGLSAGPVLVDGYTDAKGDPGYNQRLSERRAAAVADALGRAQPAVLGRVSAKGHGAADPLAPNQEPDGSDDPVGRAKNRRVTITYTVLNTRR